MARFPFRKVVLSGIAAVSFATVTSPDTNQTLSNQRGNAQAAETDMTRLTAEARALSREYAEISFQEQSLQKAQDNLATNKTNVIAQVRTLESMNHDLQSRISARDERVEKFHDELLTNRNISEADAKYLYTSPFGGEKYAYYYTERMAYRDECNSDTACMERMDDAEGSRKMASLAARGGIGFGGSLAGLFGLSALGGAAGGWRRRRAEDKHKQRLSDARDMLKPKTGL